MTKTTLASYYVLLTLILGIAGTLIEITIGLPPEGALILIVMIVMCLPAMMQIQFFPNVQRRDGSEDK